MNSLMRFSILLSCSILLLTPVYSQYDSVQRTGGTVPAAPGDREQGDLTSEHHRDFEINSTGEYRVEVFLCDGSMMYGNLLSVNDTTLSVYVYRDFSYAPLHAVRPGIHRFDFSQIWKVVLKGRSNILQGVFMGFLGGMLAGSVMTRVVEQNTSAATIFGPSALGGVGLIVGGTIGYLSSDKDLEFSKFDINDMIVLTALCRDRGNVSR